MLDPTLPLGVFHSGLGGLTVVREITAALPHERVLYLGDTARVPYGARSPETVVRYAQACARALVQRGIKALVVACNTVSAVALDVLRVDLDLPVLGAIEPGARAAVAASWSLRIGVLGTAGTVASGAYPRAVLSISTRAEVTAHAAPLLVPLVEEGWIEGEVPHLAVRRYLEPLARARVDTVVLGCTHYPILRPILSKRPGRCWEKWPSSTARTPRPRSSHMLSTRGLLRTRGDGDVELLVTDRPRTFAELTQRFLGGEEREAHVIDL